MDKLLIIAKNIYDFKNDSFFVGGVQTYVIDLAKLGLGLNKDVFIIQPGEINGSVVKNGVKIVTISLKKSFFKNAEQHLFDFVKKKFVVKSKDLIILSTDQLNIKSKDNNVISIQHGIAFDIPGNLLEGFWKKNKYLQLFIKTLKCFKNISRFNNAKNIVCVDYNYFNWYRTIGTIELSKKLAIIPNYVSELKSYEEISQKLDNRRSFKILFARRFVDYRGTQIFANVVEKLTKEFPELKITFAGEGPLKSYLVGKFKENQNISITSFVAKDSVDFHFNFDIAVVPTIFSEGTSLSLNEAMGAGCFPIATHVGGMTNMLIDGFNGKLIYPSEKHLYDSIRDCLLMDGEIFNRIVLNAYSTVSNAFTKKIWEEKWFRFINQV